jgi:hypothetical protein
VRYLPDGRVRVPFFRSTDPPLLFPSKAAFNEQVEKRFVASQPDRAGFADEDTTTEE